MGKQNGVIQIQLELSKISNIDYSEMTIIQLNSNEDLRKDFQIIKNNIYK